MDGEWAIEWVGERTETIGRKETTGRKHRKENIERKIQEGKYRKEHIGRNI
jgi:hypothetical protein